MKDSPMKNTAHWKSKHSESSEASALKYKSGGYTSASPLKIDPVTAIGLGLTLTGMVKGHSDKKKAEYKQGMSSARSRTESGKMGGVTEGPKGGF